MSKKDLRIINDSNGKVGFLVYGDTVDEDSGLGLYQRIITILLTTATSEYRPDTIAVSVQSFITGANRMPDESMNAVLAVLGAYVLSMLDTADRSRVSGFQLMAENGIVHATLQLNDGSEISGDING